MPTLLLDPTMHDSQAPLDAAKFDVDMDEAVDLDEEDLGGENLWDFLDSQY